MKFLKLDSAVIKQARKSLMLGDYAKTFIMTHSDPDGQFDEDGTDNIPD